MKTVKIWKSKGDNMEAFFDEDDSLIYPDLLTLLGSLGISFENFNRFD